MNKYVNFVNDEDFLECVKHVTNSYTLTFEDNLEDFLYKNNTGIDSFKLLFDIYTREITPDEWIEQETIRLDDKTVNNKIGEFHQKLLGKIDGWIDLKVGDKTGVDLKNEEETIFIELKNKYNTMNSNSSAKCREKLENIILVYPNSTAYWAYIIDKPNQEAVDEPWKSTEYSTTERIRKISGYKVYELVTGDSTAYQQVLDALPIAINDLYEGDHEFKLSENEKNILKKFM